MLLGQQEQQRSLRVCAAFDFPNTGTCRPLLAQTSRSSPDASASPPLLTM